MEMDLHELEIERDIQIGLEQIERGEGIPLEKALAEATVYFEEIMGKEPA